MLADEKYTVLPLASALERLRSGTLPPRSVALTFDDGTADFAQQAVPILQEFGFPATVYLTTHYSSHDLPVFDGALAYSLWRGREASIDLQPLVGIPLQLALAKRSDRERAWKYIHRYATKQGYSTFDKDCLLRRVASAIGVEYEDLVRRRIIHIMSPDVVRSLPRELIDIQLHTHRHRTPRQRALFMRELDDNRAELQNLLNSEFWLLSSNTRNSGAGFVLKRTLSRAKSELERANNST